MKREAGVTDLLRPALENRVLQDADGGSMQQLDDRERDYTNQLKVLRAVRIER